MFRNGMCKQTIFVGAIIRFLFSFGSDCSAVATDEKKMTTNPGAHLVMTDKANSRLGLNHYPSCSYTQFGPHLAVEFIGLVFHLVHTVLHLQSTEHERYSFKSCVKINDRRKIPCAGLHPNFTP